MKVKYSTDPLISIYNILNDEIKCYLDFIHNPKYGLKYNTDFIETNYVTQIPTTNNETLNKESSLKIKTHKNCSFQHLF